MNYDRLARTSESLARKMAARAEYDRTIAETEAAYSKVCELVEFSLFDYD